MFDQTTSAPSAPTMTPPVPTSTPSAAPASSASTATLDRHALRTALDVCAVVPELEGAHVALDEGGDVPLSRPVLHDLVTVLPVALRSLLADRTDPDERVLLTGRSSEDQLWIRLELRAPGGGAPCQQLARRLAVISMRGACELRVDELVDATQRITVVVPLR